MVEILSVDEVVRLANTRFNLNIKDYTTVEVETWPAEIYREYTVLWGDILVHLWYKNEKENLGICFTIPERVHLNLYVCDPYTMMLNADHKIAKVFSIVGFSWDRTLESLTVRKGTLEALIYQKFGGEEAMIRVSIKEKEARFEISFY